MVAYHDFEGITIHADEAPRLLKSIGDKPAVILRNHGLLAWGQTLPQAFVRLWTLQRACEIQVAQAALGAAIPVPEAVAAALHARRVAVRPSASAPARMCSTRWCARSTASTPATRTEPMKVCIYGAGAIGGWLGVELARAGLRGQRGGARRHAGGAARARACACSGEQRHAGGAGAAPARTRRTLGVQDLVVVAVKAPAMAGGRAGASRRCSGPDTIVLTAMNGVPWWFFEGFGGAAGRHAAGVRGPGRRDRARRSRRRHIIGCVVHASCSLDAPGVVRHHFGNGLIIGEPSGEKTQRVRELADAAGAGRLRDRAVAADPEGHLVQALGQHDGQPDQRDDRRHHRPDPGRRPGARLHLAA